MKNNRLSTIIASIAFLLTFVSYSQNTDSIAKPKKDPTKLQVIPFPNLSKNQVFGWGGGINVAFMYHVNKKDSVSPASMTVLQPMYFENGTWWGAVYSETYFSENKWRSVLLMFTSNINFQFYTQDYLPDFDNKIISYRSQVLNIAPSIMRRISPGFYAGLNYIYTKNKLSFPENPGLETAIDKFKRSTKTESGIGVTLSFDNRDNVYDSTKGSYLTANNYTYFAGIGSDVNYNFAMLEYSFFKRLSSKIVLASKFGMQISWGDVPFIDENVEGFGGLKGMDLRGYNKGEYRGEQMYNLQTELRMNVYKPLV